jgi:hypothetical protein
MSSSANLRLQEVDELRVIRRLVLIDDFCGSGTTATRAMTSQVQPALEHFQALGVPEPEIVFLFICGTEAGTAKVRGDTRVTASDCALLFDRSFKVVDVSSRFFGSGTPLGALGISRLKAREILNHYGTIAYKAHPLGYKNGQLLLAFDHNTPNNTLPIFWKADEGTGWKAILPRHTKAGLPGEPP